MSHRFITSSFEKVILGLWIIQIVFSGGCFCGPEHKPCNSCGPSEVEGGLPGKAGDCYSSCSSNGTNIFVHGCHDRYSRSENRDSTAAATTTTSTTNKNKKNDNKNKNNKSKNNKSNNNNNNNKITNSKNKNNKNNNNNNNKNSNNNKKKSNNRNKNKNGNKYWY